MDAECSTVTRIMGTNQPVVSIFNTQMRKVSAGTTLLRESCLFLPVMFRSSEPFEISTFTRTSTFLRLMMLP